MTKSPSFSTLDLVSFNRQEMVLSDYWLPKTESMPGSLYSDLAKFRARYRQHHFLVTRITSLTELYTCHTIEFG